MKADNYTKVVLTVIATCLIINTFEKINIIPKANAAPVTAPALSTPTPQYGLIPINQDGSINVTITNQSAMDVKITGINTFDAMPVNIQEVSSQRIYDAVPVKATE